MGGLANAARHDGRAMNEAARKSYRASFLDGHTCPACGTVVLPAELGPSERQRRADALYRLHMSRLAYASAKKRSRKAATAGARLPTATKAAEPFDEHSAAEPAA